MLAAKAKDIELNGKSVAELADRVLPALTAAMSCSSKQAPAEADNFRVTVLLAVEAAAQVHPDEPSTTMAEMARKITAALDAAGVATADSRAARAAAAGQDRPELQKAIEEIVDVRFRRGAAARAR